MIVVRAMTEMDIDPVIGLEKSTPDAPHWERPVYEQIVRTATKETALRAAWVAFEGQDLLGFAVASVIVDTSELESIVVAEHARRKGIGKALLGVVTSWASARGAQKMELEVRAGNERAIRFYERAGLAREGLRPAYYRDPEEDAVLMGRALYSEG